MIYSYLERSFFQKASDQTNVAVGEKYLLALAEEPLVPGLVKGFLNIEKDSVHLLTLAGGLRNVFHQSHQLMIDGVRCSEAELFGNQHVQSFEVFSYPTEYEALENF